MLFRFWVFPDCTFLDISIYYPANTACYLEELCYGSGEDGNYCTYQCCNFI